jgi:hypothetical protein
MNYTIIKQFCDSIVLKYCIVIENTHAQKISARLEQWKWSKNRSQDLTPTNRKTERQESKLRKTW